MQVLKAAENFQNKYRNLNLQKKIGESDIEFEKFVKKWASSPDILEQIVLDYRKLGIVGEEFNILLSYLTMTSRKMDNPLALLLQSSSASGKSTIQEKTITLCLESEVINLSALTPKALFYREGSIKNKLICIEEVAGLGNSFECDALYPIRGLISQKVLRIESTIVCPDGKLRTMINEKHGPTAIMLTNVKGRIDAETKSRFIVSNLTETESQTRDIIESQKNNFSMAGLEKDKVKKQIIKKHHIFQKLLNPVKVVNPYASHLSFSAKKVEFRREISKYLQIIATIAFLRQYGKEIEIYRDKGGKEIKFISVDLNDIKKGNELYAYIAHSITQTAQGFVPNSRDR